MSMHSKVVEDPLLEYRCRFPILSRSTYLISNSLGAMPAKAREDLNSYADAWERKGVKAWEEDWWMLASELGDLVAPLIGAKPAEVVFQPCVTLAHAVVFSSFEFIGKRRKIVTDSMHFPSILYLLRQLERTGAELSIVPSEDGVGVDVERIVEAIDETTAFVSLSHVYFKSAYVQALKPISEKAKSVGAIFVADGYQAVGTIPVDVLELGPHVYIGGCLKWLCGGPGNAFLWVHPQVRAQLEPKLTGWMAHTNPFAFSIDLDRRQDAWRVLHGHAFDPLALRCESRARHH